MTGSLTIECFRIAGLAPADHGAPDRLKATVEKLDVKGLSRQIGAALGKFGADDKRVIILRRLDLALSEACIDDVDRLARRLAEGVAVAVARLSTMDATESIAIFASPGVRLAALLAALVRGDAWGRWWLSDFEALRPLPVSSAIRVALLRKPEDGWEALRELNAGDRLRVAASLSAIDAELILEGIAPALGDGDDGETWVAAFSLPPVAAALAVPLAILHDLSALGATSAEALPRSMLTALRLRITLERAAGALTAPAFTAFGGIFLLWPHLPAIDEAALPDGPGNKACLLALISLSGLFGPARCRAALADPVLRSAFGIDARAGESDFADWLGRLRPSALPDAVLSSRAAGLPPALRVHRRQARAVKGMGLAALADFARRLPGFAGASLPFLRANMLGTSARVLIGNEVIHAVIDRPPLDVLLCISGLSDRIVDVSGGRRLELERAP